MHHRDGGGGVELGEKIPVSHGVHAVRADFREFQDRSHRIAISGVGHSGQGAAPQGQHIHTGGAVGEPADVTFQHFEVGQYVMGEQDRLSALQVCVARHHNVDVLFREADQGALYGPQAGNRVANGGAGVQAHVQGNLVVA